METLNKYRVHMTVRGGVSRPPYSGYVDVFAEDEYEARDEAKRKLHRTSFRDVWLDAFVVHKVESLG